MQKSYSLEDENQLLKDFILNPQIFIQIIEPLYLEENISLQANLISPKNLLAIHSKIVLPSEQKELLKDEKFMKQKEEILVQSILNKFKSKLKITYVNKELLEE